MTAAWPQRDRTARRAERAALSFAIVATAALCVLAGCGLAGCIPPSGKSGVPGEQDVALFDAATQVVFSQRVTVGSTFEVFVVGRRGDDEQRVVDGSLTSSDEGVLRVVSSFIQVQGEGDSEYRRHNATVELTGPGEAFLQVEDEGGEIIDRVLFQAAVPKTVELLDGTLLGSVVDARLPSAIGLVDRQQVPFAVAATDRCGGAMLDVGGVALDVLDPATLEDEEPAASPYLEAAMSEPGLWTLEGALPEEDPLTPRNATLELRVPGVEEPLRYDVKVVPASAVDEVDVAVATAEPGSATLWGRAYADDDEVIGLSYEWDGNDRVTLSVGNGATTTASISFPAEGEPTDERPALVSAEVFGTEEELDLLSLKDESELTPGRVPPVEDDTTPTGPSCGGSEKTCDPYEIAFLLGAVLLGRRLRRSQRRKAEGS